MASAARYADGQGSLDQSSKEELEAQRAALDSIVGLLLSAGYFRARIPSLQPFDKVIGGLCWCIAGSGEDVDVDIFYDDELNLGQKIRLGENVIRVLRDMRCPVPLQANQIQGQDWVSVYPVIQWLVVKVEENRRATGDTFRYASVSHFDKLFRESYRAFYAEQAAESAAPQAAAKRSAAASDVGFVTDVLGRYRPVRRYQRNQEVWAQDKVLSIDDRVQTCLLEFGERSAAAAVAAMAASRSAEASAGGAVEQGEERTGTSEFDKKFADMERSARAEEEERARAAAEAEEEELAKMRQNTGGKVSGRSVVRAVGLGGDALRRSKEAFRAAEEALKQEAESGSMAIGSKLGKAHAHKRRVARLTQQAEQAEATEEVATERLEAVKTRLSGLEDQVQAANDQLSRAQVACERMAGSAQRAGKVQEWREFRRLLASYAALKAQEEGFRAGCKRQRGELRARLEELEAQARDGEAEAALAAAEARLAEAVEKEGRLRALLARKKREIDRAQRELDAVPSAAELMQYEKRREEFCDQIYAYGEETRKYYAMYNTLNKTREFMAKEESLVGDISSKFQSNLRSRRTQQPFLDQCSKIIGNARRSAANWDRKVAGAEQQRDAISHTYDDIKDEERAYFRTLKKFQQAVARNEQLTAQAAAAGVSLE